MCNPLPSDIFYTMSSGASCKKVLKLHYTYLLFAKERVAKNFAGLPPGDLLERLIELSLYTEENLK